MFTMFYRKSISSRLTEKQSKKLKNQIFLVEVKKKRSGDMVEGRHISQHKNKNLSPSNTSMVIETLNDLFLHWMR